MTVRRDAPTVPPPTLAPILVDGAWVPVHLPNPWRRVAATALDAVPFLALGLGVAFLVRGHRISAVLGPGLLWKNVDTKTLGLPAFGSAQPVAIGELAGALAFLGALLTVWALWAAYRVVAVARFGRTAGKWLLGLAVVDVTDPRRHPSMAQAVKRFLVPQGSGLVPLPFTGWAPYVWILRDPQRRGLHDKAAGTLVVTRLR